MTHLQARWRGRQEAQGVAMVAELTGALAWFSLMAPVGSMSALLGGETRSANGILIACFNAVALLTLIELTFQAGMMGLVNKVSEWPVLANADAHEHDGGFGALQSLEISFMVTRSRTAWLFAMDELLLSLGWALTAFLVYTSRGADQPISRPFAHLSVVGSVVALIGFFFHVAKEFSSMNMIAAAAITTALVYHASHPTATHALTPMVSPHATPNHQPRVTTQVYLFLLPAWLIMLGFQLRARSEAVAYADASKDAETELASTPNPAGASTSTQLPSSGAGAGAFHADETV